MLAELKRLLPGFSIYENFEKIDIYQLYDVELRVTIKKKLAVIIFLHYTEATQCFLPVS